MYIMYYAYKHIQNMQGLCIFLVILKISINLFLCLPHTPHSALSNYSLQGTLWDAGIKMESKTSYLQVLSL